MSFDSHSTDTAVLCYHCGDTVRGDRVEHDGKVFCCSGCKIVYEILQQNDMCTYYSLDKNPGNTPSAIESSRFDYLDDNEIQQSILQFTNGDIAGCTLSLPSIHCSSCIWLLEQLYKLDSGILDSKVDYLKKQIGLRFKRSETSLKKIVILLNSLGYEPEITLESIDTKRISHSTKKLYYKIGVAGFCFGNAMLFSFPEYFGIAPQETTLRMLFSYLNLLLSLPVFFYSASEYFTSAIGGLRKKIINIDVPVSLGVSVLFFRSWYEIISHTGVGFIDSLCGLVFFLLIGKLFQSKTYDTLNFERNYKSYFPLSVTTKKNGVEKSIPLSALVKGERIVIRNNEIIPADSILLKGTAAIDYSFVTGESHPVEKVLGEMIYAGGKQRGGTIEMEVMKDVSQSYLTQLWNNFEDKARNDRSLANLSNTIAKYFTAAVLGIAFLAGAYWMSVDVTTAVNVVTGILIVACPCALALSIPFTFGTTLRIFGHNKLYLKNVDVLENLADIDTIVFDKTGTITTSEKSSLRFVGSELSEREQTMVRALAMNSIHPLSRMIVDHLNAVKKSLSTERTENRSLTKSEESLVPDSLPADLSAEEYAKEETAEQAGSFRPDTKHQDSIRNDNQKSSNELTIEQFNEDVGKGIRGMVESHTIKLGSREFTGGIKESGKVDETRVYLSIDDTLKGYFTISNTYRRGMKELVGTIGKRYRLAVISGDNESERVALNEIFPLGTEMRFNQLPGDKFEYVDQLQQQHKNVLMIGDGLNDIGALLKSNVGIAINENISNFTPASDAILEGTSFHHIGKYLHLARASKFIVKASFVISFLYNFVGLYFAVNGWLAPVVAAILMPISSISIVIFTTLTTKALAKRQGLLI